MKDRKGFAALAAMGVLPMFTLSYVWMKSEAERKARLAALNPLERWFRHVAGQLCLAGETYFRVMRQWLEDPEVDVEWGLKPEGAATGPGGA